VWFRDDELFRTELMTEVSGEEWREVMKRVADMESEICGDECGGA
jgi:hypothetical protein